MGSMLTDSRQILAATSSVCGERAAGNFVAQVVPCSFSRSLVDWAKITKLGQIWSRIARWTRPQKDDPENGLFEC